MPEESREKYKVVVLGSFRKHYEKITEVIDCFTNNGFEVLSPEKANIVNPEDEFILFDTDKSNDPKVLEEIVLNKMIMADIIYICNVGGYIGKSVSFELGYLMTMREKVFFLERWTESFFNEFFDDSRVLDPDSLCKKIKEDNSEFKQ